MMKNKKVCYIILSHERAKNQITFKMLKKCGVDSKCIFILIDNEDKQEDEYKTLYENILVFDKKKEENEADTFDNSGNNNVVLFARNYGIKWAKQNGYDFAVLLDDDITTFMYRYVKDGKMRKKNVNNINKVINCVINYIKKTNIDMISFGNEYDYIGGINGGIREGIRRKANGVFVINLKKHIKFISRFNEDINTCYTMNQKGALIFSIMCIKMVAKNTGNGKGGMESCYKTMSDYNKCFYSVICLPSMMKIVNKKNGDIILKKSNDCPKIISERYKK